MPGGQSFDGYQSGPSTSPLFGCRAACQAAGERPEEILRTDPSPIVTFNAALHPRQFRDRVGRVGISDCQIQLLQLSQYFFRSP